MTATKIWGLVLIVVGVIAIAWGVMGVISVYDQASQLKSMGGMFGGMGNALMGATSEMIRNEYIKFGVSIVIGIVLSIVGTKFINKTEKVAE